MKRQTPPNWRGLSFNPACLNNIAAKAIRAVVVDDASRLHPRIHNHWPNELESAFLERRRNLLRERSLCQDRPMASNRLAACHLPNVVGEIFSVLCHRDIDACAVDRRFDLGARSHDICILKQACYIALSHPRHRLRIKAAKSFAEGFTLAQNGEPRQASLEAVEHELLPQRAAVILRYAPLLVVVFAHKWVVLGPGTTMDRAFRFGHLRFAPE